VAVEVEVAVLLGVAVGEWVAVGLAVNVDVLVGLGVGGTGGAVALALKTGEGVTVCTSGDALSVGRAAVDVEVGTDVTTMPGVDEGVSDAHGVGEDGAPSVGDGATLGTTWIPRPPPGGTV
jgi:hypothetical protein